MALFVQIDHFRKTDQKPTVKNHLFSISWFRSFNRTSFQQQLKRFGAFFFVCLGVASIVHPFNNNWNFTPLILNRQPQNRFNRTSFQQQLKHFLQSRRSCNNSASIVHPFNNNWNRNFPMSAGRTDTSFNRTSFQQQLKLSMMEALKQPL